LRSGLRIGIIEEDLCPFHRKDVVLDAGTGRGYLLDKLSSKCSRVYAIDINLDFLRKIGCIIKRDNVELVQADVSRMPFKSSCFTKIVCTEVLEHLPEPSLAIEEFYKLLKPGGICIIAVPTRLSERLYAMLNPRYSQNEQQHISILKREQWLSLFRKAGLDVFAIRNENFQPALYWVFRNIFPIKYDPSSGLIMENRFTDRVFSFVVGRINRITFGGFDWLGRKILPKSWYFYLRKME
jgi:ubiquinone/menaquinone biosynthesis C-methylase UbiE